MTNKKVKIKTMKLNHDDIEERDFFDIVSEAVEKAIKNGYLIEKNLYSSIYQSGYDFIVRTTSEHKINIGTINDIIFNHQFAKAFFGTINKGWKYHLQQMVIQQEPLKYLEKFL